jgi:acetoacetyl-CoA synthetase
VTDRAAPLWSPLPERAASTRMHAFALSAGVADYPSLHRWSIEQPEAFWSRV